jgi:hypothetical protein
MNPPAATMPVINERWYAVTLPLLFLVDDDDDDVGDEVKRLVTHEAVAPPAPAAASPDVAIECGRCRDKASCTFDIRRRLLLERNDCVYLPRTRTDDTVAAAAAVESRLCTLKLGRSNVISRRRRSPLPAAVFSTADTVTVTDDDTNDFAVEIILVVGIIIMVEEECINVSIHCRELGANGRSCTVHCCCSVDSIQLGPIVMYA